jgi:regulator of cell morphogenesis and NO signaling
MTFDKNQTVREIAINNPASVRVLENFGIDYCCGGKRRLDEACASANAPIDRVVEALDELDVNSISYEEEWTNSSLADLTSHIVGRHHRYVRDESPRIELLLQKVVDRHGEAHPELSAIQDTFVALLQELFAHMMKEERVLFPFLEAMEGRTRPPTGAARLFCLGRVTDQSDVGRP